MIRHFADEQWTSGRGSIGSKGGNSFDDGIVKDLVLLCSEKAAYVYSLPHVVQVKEVNFFDIGSSTQSKYIYSRPKVYFLFRV